LNNPLSTLLQLEHECKKCESLIELFYTITNETRQIVDYTHAVLLTKGLTKELKVVSLSDVASVESTSPFVQWIEDVAKAIKNNKNPQDVYTVNSTKEFETLDVYTNENVKNPKILWLPLKVIKENIEVEYTLILIKKNMWKKEEIAILKHLASSYSYFLFAMRKCGIKTWLENKNFTNKYIKYIFIGLFLLMFFPVHQTVLAPLEVKAKNPYIVTSPLNAAIKTIHVNPNEKIEKETLTVEIEALEFENSYKIAQKELEVAKARLHTARQKSFYDTKQKSELSRLQTEVSLKSSQVSFAKSQLEKTKIYTKKSGIVLLNNKSEWEGKPVVIGERILQIADPSSIELEIMLPMNETIFLEDNASIKVFFDNDPLTSWNGTVKYIAYKPELSVNDVLSYKITAEFNNIKENEYIPSIGIRGTAKIYSKKVSLFFYLFRRPITSLRQLIGW